MNDATRALDALLEELTRRGSPIASFMNPGLPKSTVEAKLRQAGALAHADVVALYVWHNGFDRLRVPVSDEGIVSLVAAHREFNPLDECIGEFVEWRRLAGDEADVPQRRRGGDRYQVDPDTVWSQTWFPIFHGPGSEVIFISNQADDSGSVWWHPVQDKPHRLFASLGAAMNELREALADGRLRLDDVGVYTKSSRLAAGVLARL